MITCPFCQFSNEDGSLFCEQCKSDLGQATAVPAAATAAAAPAVATVAGPGIAVAAEAFAPASVAVAAPPAEAVPVATLTPEPGAEPVAAMVLEAAPAAEVATAAPPAEVMAPAPAAEPIIAAATVTAEAIDMPAAAPAAPTADGTAAADGVPAPAEAAPPAPVAGGIAAGVNPKLVVIRGLKIGLEYPLYEGHNFIGRMDDKPVDIDLEDQESPDRVLCSRQHALITFEDGQLVVEDLNSSNGTFVNRNRIYPGQRKPLQPGDVLQMGSVQMRVKV